MFTLYIGNKNYSSWSLRPWVLMRTLEMPFEERLVPFGSQNFQAFSPTGQVPCLHHEGRIVWDSLSIVEYLAEREPRVWPAEPTARAWARSACAELHAGFRQLRATCTFNLGVRVQLNPASPELLQELKRLSSLWEEGLRHFGGPFLTGRAFTAVDAFFAPVAFRVQTYGLTLPPHAQGYAELLRSLPAMQEWQEAALREPWRDLPHEAELLQVGRVVAELRGPALPV